LKKFWYACSKSFKDCCRGTAETSDNHSRSSNFLA
jgi:hypothetical protein